MTDADVTLGEVGRRVDRLDAEMRAGFAGLRDEISRLAFVPAAVYSADRSADAERVRRLEADVRDEIQARQAAEQTAGQRAWQTRLSLLIAVCGMPLSVVGSIIAALVVARLQ